MTVTTPAPASVPATVAATAATDSPLPQSQALQAAWLRAISGLAELTVQLAESLSACSASNGGHGAGINGTSPSVDRSTTKTGSGGPTLWDELSVVELRALLRSYPIDRTSLPAPIELLRRGELIEALSQIQAMGI